jgi:hypothetical protein
LSVATCGGESKPGAEPTADGTLELVAETPTRVPEGPTVTPTPTPTRIVQAVEETPTATVTEPESSIWDGTYEGTVTWDCGGGTTREGTLEGKFVITVDGVAATLDGENTVTGSCAGTGALTTAITLAGERTGEGFEFPGELFGLAEPIVIEVSGSEGEGRAEGAIPGPAQLVLEFEVRQR